jgi:hypothetical protein
MTRSHLCSEELNRPENAYLKPLAARVKEAKAAVFTPVNVCTLMLAVVSSQRTAACCVVYACSEELNRPENAYLKPLAARVKEAKAAVDAAVDPKGPKIGYADLMVLATKVATTQAWKEVKVRQHMFDQHV